MNCPVIFDLLCIFPELILAGFILLFIILTAFLENPTRLTTFIGKISIALCLFLFSSFLLQDTSPVYMFNGFFVRDSFSLFLKACIASSSLCILLFTLPILSLDKLARPEYLIFFLTALLGMLFMVSSNHFIALYLAIELQSLTLYILCGFKKNSIKNSEAAVKFFILGALASAFLLFGLSFIYGFAGSLNYQDIAFVLKGMLKDSTFSFQNPMFWSVFLGITFIMVSLLFKIAAAPFHMWAPDVYEGIPLPVMAFLSLVSKIAIIAVLLKIFSVPFIGIFHNYTPKTLAGLFPFFFQFIALISIIWGAIAALFQCNIRRLLAYSGINHVGFLLLALSSGSYSGFHGAVLYALIYVLMTIVILGILCALRYPAGHMHIGLIEDIQDLRGLSRTHPKVALALALTFLSMAGIPPLAGFFAKFYVLLSVLENGYIIPAIIALLASVIGSFYYLRIIKYIYFEEPEKPLEIRLSFSSALLISLSLFSIALYSFYPTPFLSSVNLVTDALLKS